MNEKEMQYILINKIFTVFTNYYLLNDHNDPNLDYLRIRNILVKIIDKDTYDYTNLDFTYYYDPSNCIIIKDINKKEDIDLNILNNSILLVKKIILELSKHTSYYPLDSKIKYLEYLETKRELLLKELEKYSKPKILAKVI